MDKEQRLIWEGYDVDKVRKALARSAGAFREIDTGALSGDIHGARKQDSQEGTAT